MKISYPERGWTEVSFSTAELDDFEPPRVFAIETLAQMPGVRFWKEDEKLTLKVPGNVFNTDAWVTFADEDVSWLTGSFLEEPYPRFMPQRPLFKHQIEAVTFLHVHEGGLLADTMGLGKLQDVNSEVLTPTGWRRIGDLAVGDLVIDPDTGEGAPVTGVFPQGRVPLFAVYTSDGACTTAGAEHLWLVTTPTRKHAGADYVVRSTQALLNVGLRTTPDKRGWTNRRWFLPLTQPVRFAVGSALPFDPYALGVALGDGTFPPGVNTCAVSNVSDEIHAKLAVRTSVGARRSANPEAFSLPGPFVALGLAGRRAWEKFVPTVFMRADVDARLALLRGLMDTDGDCTRGGVATFNTTSRRLRDDVVTLVRELGGVASTTTREHPRYVYNGETRIGRTAYRVNVRLPMNPFTLARKAERWRRPLLARAIDEIRPIEAREAVCIRVASKRSLYITDGHIVTHNTASAIVAAERLADGSPRPRLIVGPKYTRAVWKRELLALGAIKDESEIEFGAGRDPHANFNFDAKYWFVHYDVAYAWANRLSVTPRGQRGRPIVAIVDECHWLRNPKAQRTKGASALVMLAPNRILLTGTPLANRPSELWQLLSILDGRGWGARHDFRVRYCGAMTTEHGFTDGAPTHVDELQQRMRRRYLRRELNSAGVELPPMRRTTLLTDLSDDEATEHASLVKQIGGVDELLRAVLERRAGTRTLPLISKLRKITSDAKVKATIDYATDVLESGQSCVIFCWRRETVVQLQRALLQSTKGTLRDGAQIYAVTGEQDQDDRDDTVSMFQEVGGGALIATLDCLKEGVTLTRATHVIIHDLSWVPVEVLQGEARIYRIGQKLPVTSVWCLASNSIDELLARVVSEKAKTMQTVMKIDAAQDAVQELKLPEFLGGSTAEHNFSALFKAIGIEVEA